MAWLLEQAQTASPFVAVFCLIVSALACRVLWNQHCRDQDTILSLSQRLEKSMTATARALARLATLLEKKGK